MSITIVATVGAAAANSFATEVEAIAYMATRLNASAWASITGATCTETEKAALVEATRDLSAREWVGRRTDDTQALSWPRQWATDPDSPTGLPFDNDVLPQRVKDATIELAFQYLKAGTTDLAAVDPNAGIVEKKVDVISTRWEGWLLPTGLERFPSVLRFIRPLLAGSPYTTTLVRG